MFKVQSRSRESKNTKLTLKKNNTQQTRPLSWSDNLLTMDFSFTHENVHSPLKNKQTNQPTRNCLDLSGVGISLNFKKYDQRQFRQNPRRDYFARTSQALHDCVPRETSASEEKNTHDSKMCIFATRTQIEKLLCSGLPSVGTSETYTVAPTSTASVLSFSFKE